MLIPSLVSTLWACTIRFIFNPFPQIIFWYFHQFFRSSTCSAHILPLITVQQRAWHEVSINCKVTTNQINPAMEHVGCPAYWVGKGFTSLGLFT